MKLIFNNPKEGSSYARTLEFKDLKPLEGKKIGDKIKGEIFDLQGYEFEITGGCDNDGFPMRKSLEGTVRKRSLLGYGWGMKDKVKGIKRKRLIRGNTINQEISQLTFKVIKEGSQKLGELFKKEEEKK